eukprot:scaffold85731_cov31-Tisochrysis_lutea.AAC.2
MRGSTSHTVRRAEFAAEARATCEGFGRNCGVIAAATTERREDEIPLAVLLHPPAAARTLAPVSLRAARHEAPLPQPSPSQPQQLPPLQQ